MLQPKVAMHKHVSDTFREVCKQWPALELASATRTGRHQSLETSLHPKIRDILRPVFSLFSLSNSSQLPVPRNSCQPCSTSPAYELPWKASVESLAVHRVGSLNESLSSVQR